MKSKKLLTALCLFALSGCQFAGISMSNNNSSVNNSTTAVSTSSESENHVSSTTNKTSSTSSTSTNTSSKVDNSTSSTVSSSSSSSSLDEKASFDSETQALFDSYFNFEIPCLDLEYEIADLTSDYDAPCVVLYFLDASESDLANYVSLCNTAFTYLEEGEYEGDYWYIYEKGNYYIDLCYDDYSYTVPFIYVQIYDKVIVEGDTGGSGDSSTGWDSSTQALFDSYFDFNVPFIDLEYEIADETSTYGLPCVVIWFYDATASDFEAYLNLYAAEFDYSGETEYEGDYWYFFETDDFYMDLYYDDYTYSTSYIYVQIYDKVIADGDTGGSGSDSEFDGTPTVDGYFNDDDSYALHYLLGFEVPCVGDYYEIYYYVEDVLDVMIYYNYTTMDDYESLVNQLSNTFEYLGNEVINDVDYAMFAYEDFYLYAGYNENSREYPYILLEIYCPTYGTGSSDSGESYYNYAEFVDGDFVAEDKEFLNGLYGFVPPCVGDEYEVYDFRNEYGCVALYYYGVSASDYASLLDAFAESFIYNSEYESDGYVYYYYICGDHFCEVVYDEYSEYVQVAIYSF